MSTLLHHEMIKASAGSGKTYALVNRYLRLLALGVDPTRITALTFTRKAAGEFLNKIFLRLTEAAESEDGATALCKDLGLHGKDCTFFRPMLSTMVGEIGRLQLGTIDHFFGRIVGAFPFELGLARPHRIMDDFEQDLARELTIQQLVESSGGQLDAFVLQMYKNLTWGGEEKNVYGIFEKNLKTYHHVFIEKGDPGYWGNESLMYSTNPWWASAPDDVEALTADIEQHLDAAGLKKGITNAILKLLGIFREWQPGQDPKAGTLLERLLEAREELERGSATLKYGPSVVDIPIPLGQSLHGLLQYYVGGEIKRSLLIAKSLGQFLEAYDLRYAQLVRETGSLVFADLPMLLSRAFSRNAAMLTGEDLLYRLDSRTDHWLLDEFQDTSRIQWKVLSRFIDEVLQDSGNQRSFFYVGDVKQSIYTWRGGDPRLFDEIFKYYQGSGSGIRKDVRKTSWRSGPAVLECVNRFFGEGMKRMPLPDAVRDRWRLDWEDHVPSSKTTTMDGYAAWGRVDEDQSVEEACIRLLQKIDPLERGLSCAVLMRENDAVRSMTQALRAERIPASMEGSVRIAMDNVAGSWIRAFLYTLARPGEKFPRQYLDMAGRITGESGYHKLADSVRRAITEEGYAEAVRRILGHLGSLIGDNPFLQRRSEQLLEAAARYQGTGQDSLEKFINYLEKRTVEESTIHGQVQVMTVHKAKGLDFDMVVVAGFGHKEIIRSAGRTLHVERNETGEVQWIMEMPRKQVVQADPCLNQAGEAQRNDELYESLCILYVAMTRARQGLYCIAEPYTKSGESLRWHHLFEAAFSDVTEEFREDSVSWQCKWGNAGWFKAVHREVEEPASIRIPVLGDPLPQTPVFLKLEASPSSEAHAAVQQIHRLGSARGRRFGTRMHNFLATVEWIHFEDQVAVERLIHSVDEDLRERFAAFVLKPIAREVFKKPDRPCLLWREKPYALRDGKVLTQGIIDRAHVFLDKDGKPEEIIIFDYKTDQLDPDRPAEEQLQERYSRQLERYVEAVVVLTGLSPESVSTRLIPV